ncbi:MAG: arylsulfatase [Chitinophagaceae bacterium]
MMKLFNHLQHSLFILSLLLLSHYSNARHLQKPSPAKNARPNVVYIFADDLGYGDVGAYGQLKIKTPNLDKMAKDGMRFTQHYTSTPVCAPSRCMLMTGRNGGHSYIRDNYELGAFADSLEGGQMPLPEGTFTIGHLMQQAGYTTGAIGKWGLGLHSNTGDPNKQGFNFFYGYLDQKQAHNYYPSHLWKNGSWDKLNNPFIDVHKRQAKELITPASLEAYKGKDYAVDKLTANALQFIQDNKSAPFFLYLPYTLPHSALQVPDDEINYYIDLFKEKPVLTLSNYIPTYYPLSTYAAMVTYLDKQVGMVQEQLLKLGLDQNTIIMFSSDNGPAASAVELGGNFFKSAGPFRGMKQDLYEGGIREPFIVMWPGKIKPGSVSDLISVQYDMMATLSEITGVKAPPNDGISFLPTMLGNNAMQKKRAYIYFEFPEKGGQVAIRMGDWKGVRRNVKQNVNAPWELYNLAVDIGEKNDVSAANPAIVQQLKELAKKEHRCSHVREWEFVDPKFANVRETSP